MNDTQIRDAWREAGGKFHGPHVEHGYMEETALLRFLHALYARINTLENALEPFAAALTQAERDEPKNVEHRLECCRTDLTLYEFGNARLALTSANSTGAKQ